VQPVPVETPHPVQRDVEARVEPVHGDRHERAQQLVRRRPNPHRPQGEEKEGPPTPLHPRPRALAAGFRRRNYGPDEREGLITGRAGPTRISPPGEGGREEAETELDARML